MSRSTHVAIYVTPASDANGSLAKLLDASVLAAETPLDLIGGAQNIRGPCSIPVFTASRSVASTNHLPPGTEMLVNPARRIGIRFWAAHSAQNSALVGKPIPSGAPWNIDRWTCPSMSPGRMNLPAASIKAPPPGSNGAFGPTSAIFPPRITIRPFEARRDRQHGRAQ